MKIKMPCKLCEMSIEQKFGGIGCTHSPIFLNGSVPPFVHPIGFGLQNNPFIQLPQIRDMMLAAYLLRAGYYQPAGPLISVPHGHGQPPPGAAPPAPPLITKTAPLSEASPSVASHEALVPPPPPSSNGDSSDSEVIITSVTTAKEAAAAAAAAAATSAPPTAAHPYAAYRYHQYSNAPPPTYPYSYLPHPYPTPPTSYAQHDLCYSPSPYVNVHKYLPCGRRYYPPPPAAQQEMYPNGPPPQQVPPPPPIVEPYAGPQAALVDAYQPPPPPHYYPPTYGPSCYTHSPSRAMPYLNATYQSCPCPMQSCPKNVLTGPLTGESKRSSITSISKDSIPLPPVALALPLEPATPGPPSPARGSAGMPPPPSPAGATYQPPPPQAKLEPRGPVVDDCKVEKKRKARIGKAMVRSHIAAANMQQNTMLLMCKRELESPKGKEVVEERKAACCADLEAKPAPVEATLEVLTLEEEIKKEEPAPAVPPVEKEDRLVVEEPGEKEAEKEEEVKPEEVLPPVVSTVAENVKVKNMKRSLSMSKEKVPDPELSPSPKKKQKLGSYKCLIKREMSGIKIDNGKQKLISDQALRKNKSRKSNKRRNSNSSKEESAKRLRLSKPLSLSNFSSKMKEKNNGGISEVAKKISKKAKVNSKSAPLALDNLFARNNVERIIESVVSEGSQRTQEDDNETAKVSDKCGKAVKEIVLATKKSANKVVGASKAKKTGITRRKSKCKEVVVPQEITKVPRRSLVLPRWSNGWIWEGEPYEGKVFINSDETTVLRKCFPAMRHEEGDKIVPRDCVLLKAGPRKNDLPFVAKIASLWENPDDGEMMMSLLWYYRPEHTEQGRLDSDQPDEVFASRHKDSNSVACIDDKCYVLTFNEYCRYRKEYRRIEAEIEEPPPCIPNPEPYPRSHRQPPKTQISPEMVFFCRRVYDFRQKRIMKNPT